MGFVFGPGLDGGSLASAAVTLFATMFTLGFANGPLGGFLSRLFPVPVRYSGISVAFNTGGIIGGAMTPIAAQWLSSIGAANYAGVLLVAAGLLTLIGVKLARPVSD